MTTLARPLFIANVATKPGDAGRRGGSDNAAGHLTAMVRQL